MGPKIKAFPARPLRRKRPTTFILMALLVGFFAPGVPAFAFPAALLHQAAAGAKAPTNVSGTYSSEWGTVVLTQTGASIRGYWLMAGGKRGTIDFRTLNDDALTLNYTWGNETGTAVFAWSGGESPRWEGNFLHSGGSGGAWNLVSAGSSAAPITDTVAVASTPKTQKPEPSSTSAIPANQADLSQPTKASTGTAPGDSRAPALAVAKMAGTQAKVEGYAEWRHGDFLVVDGQTIRTNQSTKFKGHGKVKDPRSVPLGYEVKVSGVRAPNGAIVASEMEAKPNGIALLEKEVLALTNDMESRWTKEGHVYEELGPGKTQDIGKLLLNGASVDRVRNIVNRLVPPYLNPSGFRVYVVENSEWNAFACANGMIVVHSAMLNDMKDDELAIVLGHELVHATHEHTRKQFKRGLWLQIVALGLDAGLEAAGKGKSNTKSAIDALAAVGLLAWKNGYSRELEDQADRVGLRYAYEAGYSVRTAPLLWKRFAEKYKDSNRVVNFFFGDHSLSKDRAVKLDREIELNYSFQQ